MSSRLTMHITVDLRSLHSKNITGVEYFTTEVLEPLLTSDKTNRYLLYYNAFQPKQFEQFHFINATYKQTRWPNRLLNLLFKIFSWPTIESLTGEQGTVLMPNPNMIAMRSTTKLILVVHDLSPILMPEMYSWKARLWHKFINIPKLVKRADKLIAVSGYTKQALHTELGAPLDKITVAHLGVDHERFRPDLDVAVQRSVRNRYSLPGEFLLYIGTIEPRKNIERLIEAFEQAEISADLVLAGKLGWRADQIMEKIRKSPKGRQIHYLGYVSEEDKPALLKLARAFVWPSLYEGFGLPPLEAAAVGTPVLVSSVTSLPEVLADSALLVNPYNVSEISRGMEVLLNEETLREQYIKRGLDRAQKFDWVKTAQIIKQVIS